MFYHTASYFEESREFCKYETSGSHDEIMGETSAENADDSPYVEECHEPIHVIHNFSRPTNAISLSL